MYTSLCLYSSVHILHLCRNIHLRTFSVAYKVVTPFNVLWYLPPKYGCCINSNCYYNSLMGNGSYCSPELAWNIVRNYLLFWSATTSERAYWHWHALLIWLTQGPVQNGLGHWGYEASSGDISCLFGGYSLLIKARLSLIVNVSKSALCHSFVIVTMWPHCDFFLAMCWPARNHLRPHEWVLTGT